VLPYAQEMTNQLTCLVEDMKATSPTFDGEEDGGDEDEL
jgi:hypothetical protein